LAIEFYCHDLKFGRNEDLGNSYHLNAIMKTNDNEDEVEVAIDLLNIAGTFQGIFIVICTKVEYPSSPTPRYYVEMPCSLTIPTTNLELAMNLKDPYLELDDLNVSYQNQQVPTLANFATTTKMRSLGKESLVNYSSSHVMTSDQYLAVFKQKKWTKRLWTKLGYSKQKNKKEKISKRFQNTLTLTK